MSEEKYPHFSDFADEEIPLEGEKQRIEEILNLKILVTGFRIGKSKYKDKNTGKDKNYVTIQFKNGGELFILFTSSEVLMKQLEKYKKSIPFYTTIVKRNTYYTLS